MSYTSKHTEREIEHFKEIANSLIELKTKKAGDYGNSWKVFGLMGIIYQIGSKFIRIWNLTNRKGEPNNEALEDSFRDIAIYSIMGMQLIERGEVEDAFTSFGAEIDLPEMEYPDERTGQLADKLGEHGE